MVVQQLKNHFYLLYLQGRKISVLVCLTNTKAIGPFLLFFGLSRRHSIPTLGRMDLYSHPLPTSFIGYDHDRQLLFRDIPFLPVRQRHHHPKNLKRHERNEVPLLTEISAKDIGHAGGLQVHIHAVNGMLPDASPPQCRILGIRSQMDSNPMHIRKLPHLHTHLRGAAAQPAVSEEQSSLPFSHLSTD